MPIRVETTTNLTSISAEGISPFDSHIQIPGTAHICAATDRSSSMKADQGQPNPTTQSARPRPKAGDLHGMYNLPPYFPTTGVLDHRLHR